MYKIVGVIDTPTKVTYWNFHSKYRSKKISQQVD